MASSFIRIKGRILNIWRIAIWEGSYPTLIHHLVHVCGGATVVLFFLSFGVDWFSAAVVSSLLFTVVEVKTALFKKNYADSANDLWQYQAHWILYSVHVGRIDIAVVLLFAFLLGYLAGLIWQYKL